ncbi:HNH endonuclease signature motif containing protein, partial [Mesorhizobium japonicum]|uniref:HNH endonuclease signature motif containing protein n=1 Tax=Mesorhizobium japonicum TaxID=2066070 RepID=UPI003B5C2FE5
KLKRGWSPEQVDAMIQKIGQVNDRNPVVTSVDQEARNPNPRRLYEALFGKGSAAGQDVDHILDLRLGGQNTPENLQLLDPSVNRSFGAQISNEIRRLGLGEGTEVSVSLVR